MQGHQTKDFVDDGAEPAPTRRKDNFTNSMKIGDRIRGTLGDIDPQNEVPVSESQKRVKKGPPNPT